MHMKSTEVAFLDEKVTHVFNIVLGCWFWVSVENKNGILMFMTFKLCLIC